MSDYRYQKIEPKDRYYMKYSREGGVLRLLPFWFFPIITAVIFAVIFAECFAVYDLLHIADMFIKARPIVVGIMIGFVGLFLLNLLFSGRRWYYNVEDTYLRIYNGRKFIVFQYKSVASIEGRPLKLLRNHVLLVTVDCAPMGKKKYLYIFPRSTNEYTLENSVFGILQKKVDELKQGGVPVQNHTAGVDELGLPAVSAREMLSQPQPAYFEQPLPAVESLNVYEPEVPQETQQPIFSDPISGKAVYNGSERFDMFDIVGSGVFYLYKTYYKIMQAASILLAAAIDAGAVINYLLYPNDHTRIIAWVLFALAISFFAGVAVTFLKNGQRWKYSAEFDCIHLFRNNEEHIIYYRNILTAYHEEITIRNKPYGARVTLEHLTVHGRELLEFTCVYNGKKRSDRNYEHTPFYIIEQKCGRERSKRYG